MYQSCSFCTQTSILHCVIRSLYHKHASQEDNNFQKTIDQILDQQSTSELIKCREIILMSDDRQFMNCYMKGKQVKQEFNEFIQYYKFRIFVPVFAKSAASERTLSYYYQKLKHYYNNIKRKLNMTVQPQSSSSSYISLTQSKSKISTKQEILKDLKKQFQKQKKQKKIQQITKYKSESKALEELVTFLKYNTKFQKIKTLKTQDCFYQQNIFQQNTLKKSNLRIFMHQENLKPKIKLKLFKKIIQQATGNKQIPVFEIYREKANTQVRSNSIKIMKTFDQKEFTSNDRKTSNRQLEFNSNSKNKIKIQLIPKKNSSLSKLNQNHYNSPYKRKALSNQKIKPNTFQTTKNNRSKSTQNLKLKNYQSNLNSKQSLMKMQVVRFQNTIPYKSTPCSPRSSKKQIRTGIQITKNDNILSIRKKKLQALKQKANKK